MEFFKIRRDIPFMRHALVLNAVSLITFALAVFFLFSRGLHLSVEFTGGTVMEVGYSQPADVPKVRSVIAGLGIPSWQDLPSLHGQGHTFEILPTTWLPDSLSKDEWQSATHRALETSSVLREQPSSGAWLLVHYTQDTDGTQFQAAWLDEAE